MPLYIPLGIANLVLVWQLRQRDGIARTNPVKTNSGWPTGSGLFVGVSCFEDEKMQNVAIFSAGLIVT